MLQHMKINREIHLLTECRGKNYMIISINAGKAFDKIQCPFTDKNTQQTRNRRKLLNIIKAIYEKPTANITLSGERLRAFPLKSETKPEC